MSFFKDPAFQMLAGAAAGFFLPPLLGPLLGGGAAASGAATAAGSGSGAGLASGLTGATGAVGAAAPAGVSGATHVANLIGNPAATTLAPVVEGASPSLFSQLASNPLAKNFGRELIGSALGGSPGGGGGDTSTTVATPPQQQPQPTPSPAVPSLFNDVTDREAEDLRLRLRQRNGLF